MKKAYILGIILIVAGILISQYPKLTDFLFDRKQKRKRKNLRKKNEIRK